MLETIIFYCGATFTFLFLILMLIIQLIKLCVNEFEVSDDDVRTYLDKLRFPINVAKAIPVEDYFEIKRAENFQLVIFAGGIGSFLTYFFVANLIRATVKQEQIYYGFMTLFAIYTISSMIRGLHGLTKGKSRRKRR